MATRYRIQVNKTEDRAVRKNVLVEKKATAIKDPDYNSRNLFDEKYAVVESEESFTSEILDQTVDKLDMINLIRAINGIV